MSVLSFNERFQGTGMSEDERGYSSTRVFWVRTDDPENPRKEVLEAPGVKRGDVHPVDSGLVVGSLSCDLLEDEDSLNWIVTVDYIQSEYWSASPRTAKPWASPAEIQIGFQAVDKVLDKAFKNKGATKPTVPVRNSARDQFNPPLTIPAARTLITITRNERNFDSAKAASYINTTNISSIQIAGIPIQADGGRIVDIGGTRKLHESEPGVNRTFYYSVTYSIEVVNESEGTQQFSILDQGFRELKGTKAVPILDDNQEKTEDSELLNGKGQKLPADAEAVYLDFRCYRAKNWRSLNLPIEENDEGLE